MANIQKYNRDYDRSLDNFFDNFLSDWGVKTSKFPPVDIEENKDSFVIKAEMPGFNEENIKLYVEKHVLHISAESSSNESEKEGKKYLVRERKVSSFERSFTLPEGVNEEALSASYNKGVLTVSIPKAEKAEVKKIDVKINK